MKKISRRSFLKAGAFAASAAVLSACAAASSSESASSMAATSVAASTAADAYSGPEYALQLGHVGADGSVEDVVSKRFAELLEQNSDGKIKLTIYGNSQMGGLTDLVDAVRYSTIDFALFALGNAESYYPQSAVLGLPYLFTDYSHVERYYQSDAYKALCDDYADKTGIRELGSFHTGFRVILSNVKIEKADDMKGVTIRVPEAPTFVKTFGALGCNTVTLAAADVYQALQTGMVEATEAAPSYMVSMNYQEVSKYCVKTNHIYTGNSIFVSAQKLAGMDAAAAAIVSAAAAQAATEAWDIVADQTDAAYKTIEDASVEMIDPDLESFKTVMKDLWAELFTSKVENGQKLVDEILACA